MKYDFQLMAQEQAEEIAHRWRYEGIYAFYDMGADEGDIRDFLNPDWRGESHYTVWSNGVAIGFFVFTVRENAVEIGLGMRPDLTGRGGGLEFVNAGMDYARSEYPELKLTLLVAAFNARAIKVYTRAGFREVERHIRQVYGSPYEFIRMETR